MSTGRKKIEFGVHYKKPIHHKHRARNNRTTVNLSRKGRQRIRMSSKSTMQSRVLATENGEHWRSIHGEWLRENGSQKNNERARWRKKKKRRRRERDKRNCVCVNTKHTKHHQTPRNFITITRATNKIRDLSFNAKTPFGEKQEFCLQHHLWISHMDIVRLAQTNIAKRHQHQRHRTNEYRRPDETKDTMWSINRLGKC